MKSIRIFVPVLLGLMVCSLLLGCGSVTGGGGGGGGTAGSPWIYVANSGDKDVSYINGITNTEEGKIAMPRGDVPWAIAPSYDGKKIYCLTNSTEVVEIDTTTNTTTDIIPISEHAYRGLIVSNDNNCLYVLGNSQHLIKVYLTSTPRTSETIANLSAVPACVRSNADFSKLFITCDMGSNLDTVTISDNNLTSYSIGGMPAQSFDLDIKDDHAYFTVGGSVNDTRIFDMNALTFDTDIDSFASGQVKSIINIPGTNKLYGSECGSTGALWILNTAAPGGPTYETTTITTIDASFKYPGRMCATADGKYVYVHTFVDTATKVKLAIVDTATDTIVGYAEVGTSESNYLENNPVVIYK